MAVKYLMPHQYHLIFYFICNQPISHHDPAIAHGISFCWHPIKNCRAISQPGAETILLICLRFELSVCMISVPGMVGWWHCVVTTLHHVQLVQRRVHCGAMFTSFKHLLVPWQQKNIGSVHRFDLGSPQVWCRRQLGCCLREGSKDVRAMHWWHIIN
jgi:hypothetical protein